MNRFKPQLFLPAATRLFWCRGFATNTGRVFRKGQHTVKTLVDQKRVEREAAKLVESVAASPNDRQWHFIDARDMIVGRLATKIVPLLTGTVILSGSDCQAC